ncbi:MAG: DUF475 domain-containing protein [Bacteroidota bacterium]
MEILHQLFGEDIQATLFILLNLIVIESLLSVDNAAVLATMVMDLPKEERKKALRYGIIGAYVFRGICLLTAAYLVQIWWLKPLGGLYLLYLAYDYFKGRATPEHDDDYIDKKGNWLYKMTVGSLGNFWATVALVEIMDLAFSIDNVFAVVAFTDNIYLIFTGVFIGILAMRFVAQGFVRLMEKYTFLGTIAFLVIGILGIKLTLSLYVHFYPHAEFSKILESETTDLYFSILTVALFIIPVLTSLLFNFPRRSDAESS